MNAKPDFSQTIDQFIRLQKRRRIVSDERDTTLLDLIEQSEPLDIQEVMDGFEQIRGGLPKNDEVIQAVTDAFLDAVKALNKLNPSRRLFALETFNYLGNPENLALVSEALLFANDQEIKPVALSFLQAFGGTDQVITTLSLHQDLFEARTRDSQLHALSTFRYDMSERLLALLNQDFVLAEATALAIETDLSLDLLRHIVKKNNAETLSGALVQNRQLAINLARLIGFVQGHRVMPIYAKKRADYLKNFVLDLSKPDRIRGVAPADLSKVIACFLFTNDQLAPKDELVALMVDDLMFASQTCEQAQRAFLDQLAPTTIDGILKDLRDFIKEIHRYPSHDIETAFKVAKSKYEAGYRNDGTLFGRISDAILDLKERGIVLAHSISDLVLRVKNALTFAKNEENQPGKTLDQLFDEIPEQNDLSEFRQIAKDPTALERAQDYIQVQTSEAGYRSAMSDGGKRAAAVNHQLLGDDEALQIYKVAFRALFKKVGGPKSQLIFNEFKHPQASHPVTEHYLAYLIPMPGDDPMLFCLGVGYFEKDLQWKDEDKDTHSVADIYMDPYCFLMRVRNEDNVMSARSRKLITDDKRLKDKEYKAVNLRNEAYSGACLGILLDVLHLLDDSDWEAPGTQKLLAFLFSATGTTPEYL